MTITFTDRAIRSANYYSEIARTFEHKGAMAEMARDELHAAGIYLTLFYGPREAAEMVYRLADWIAVQGGTLNKTQKWEGAKR